MKTNELRNLIDALERNIAAKEARQRTETISETLARLIPREDIIRGITELPEPACERILKKYPHIRHELPR